MLLNIWPSLVAAVVNGTFCSLWFGENNVSIVCFHFSSSPSSPSWPSVWQLPLPRSRWKSSANPRMDRTPMDRLTARLRRRTASNHRSRDHWSKSMMRRSPRLCRDRWRGPHPTALPFSSPTSLMRTDTSHKETPSRHRGRSQRQSRRAWTTSRLILQ